MDCDASMGSEHETGAPGPGSVRIMTLSFDAVAAHASTAGGASGGHLLKLSPSTTIGRESDSISEPSIAAAVVRSTKAKARGSGFDGVCDGELLCVPLCDRVAVADAVRDSEGVAVSVLDSEGVCVDVMLGVQVCDEVIVTDRDCV